MPTRSASDYLSYQKAAIITATGFPVAQTRNVQRYEGAGQYLNAVTQLSAMSYAVTGRAVPGRIAPRQFVQNRSNPKALSCVAFLGSAGPQGTLVSQPVARTSGTSSLIVLQTNLIQNANASARGSTTFTNTNAAITRA